MKSERVIQGLEQLQSRLFWSDVEEHSPRREAMIDAMMSGEEKKRCRQIRHEPTRQCFLSTRHLVRQTLSELGGGSPEMWRFGAEEHGRPYLANPTSALEGIDFNIAHSRHAVIMAVTLRGRIGVDLEPVDRQVDHELVANKFFHPTEREDLQKLDDARRRRRFLELWVLKEAWMKADGRGIGAGLRQVVYEFDGDGKPALRHLPDDDAERWQVILRRVDGHLMAVAHQQINA